MSIPLKKLQDLLDILCHQLLTHFIYTEYPRSAGPAAGDNTLFCHGVIPAENFDKSLGFLAAHYGFFRFQGANNCLVEAGIKALCSVLAEAKWQSDGSLLITYSVIQTEELPLDPEAIAYSAY